ncbi:MAG: alpha/beta fold hydrolase [Deltaproteobacteria bacterium]|nr:alpha/beta fold hydrolase [Deltaproteobacteria bacterium]
MPLRKIQNYYHQMKKDLKTTKTYFQLAFSGNKVDRVTDFSVCKRPVLLIYGFGATRRVFSILEKRLRKDGFCVFSINLRGVFDTFNTSCIEDLAQHVHMKIERLCEKYHLNKISIIGHSKGGLIGHYYVKRLGGEKRVKSLITLGTPHNGNPLAILGLVTPLALVSKSLWQMFPMSPFIRRLRKGTWPKDVRLTSIYSKNDNICYYKSSILTNADEAPYIKNIELPSMTHSDYIIRRAAYHVIRKELLDAEMN